MGRSNGREVTEISLEGAGEFGLDVVGEASYQKALAQICKGRTEGGHEKIVRATLVHEDSNPHDNKAVRVDIEGKTVGYLGRLNAREYRQRMAKAGHPGATATCSAMIVGGWDRGEGDVGHFGVKLDLPTAMNAGRSAGSAVAASKPGESFFVFVGAVGIVGLIIYGIYKLLT